MKYDTSYQLRQIRLIKNKKYNEIDFDYIIKTLKDFSNEENNIYIKVLKMSLQIKNKLYDKIDYKFIIKEFYKSILFNMNNIFYKHLENIIDYITIPEKQNLYKASKIAGETNSFKNFIFNNRKLDKDMTYHINRWNKKYTLFYKLALKKLGYDNKEIKISFNDVINSNSREILFKYSYDKNIRKLIHEYCKK